MLHRWCLQIMMSGLSCPHLILFMTIDWKLIAWSCSIVSIFTNWRFYSWDDPSDKGSRVSNMTWYYDATDLSASTRILWVDKMKQLKVSGVDRLLQHPATGQAAFTNSGVWGFNFRGIPPNFILTVVPSFLIILCDSKASYIYLRLQLLQGWFKSAGCFKSLHRHCSTDNLSTKSIQAGDSIIPTSDCVRCLGTHIDKNLKLSTHVMLKCKMAMWNYTRIKSIRPYLNRSTCETLVLSLVMSHLDYSNSILSGYPDTLINKYQRVQNLCAKLVLCRDNYSSSTQALIDLHWLPIVYHVKFKICCPCS